MRVSIITPEQTAYSDDAESVTVPTASGELTILAHHIPLVTTLAPGAMVVRKGGVETLFAVSRGILEVDGQSVRVLTDIADRAEHLQEEVIEKARADAEKLVAERHEDAEAQAEAMAVLNRELARLSSVRRHRQRSHSPHPSSAS